MSDETATPPVVDYAKAAADLKRYLPLKIATLVWLSAALGVAMYAVAATWSEWWPYTQVNVRNLDEAKPAIYAFFAGMLGATSFALRGLYWATGPQRVEERRFQFDPNFTLWYVARPILGAILGAVSFTILRAGVGTLGSAATDGGANAAYFAVGFLAGFAVTDVMTWLRQAARRVFRTRDDDDAQGRSSSEEQ